MKRLSPAQIQSELGFARQASLRGDAASANKRLDYVLASNPDCVEAHYGKGVILAGQGRHAEALTAFRQALRGDPNNPEILKWAAMTCLNLGRAEEAGLFANQLILIEPQNDRAYFLATNALCLQNRFQEALEPLEKALKLRPAEADYVMAKAQLLGRLAWSSQAIEWYRKAMTLRPSPGLASEFATSLIQEGQASEAIMVLERIWNQIPAESRPYALMGQAYTEAQRFDLAEPQWELAQIHTRDPNGLVLTRANAEICAGRLSVAEELLRDALNSDPSAGQLYMPLVMIRKLTEADLPLVESMERALSSGHLNRQAEEDLQYALGKAYNDLGEYGAAIGHYDEANRLAGENSKNLARFDAGQWRAYTDLLIEFFTEERVRSLAREGLLSDMPLFIVGMIRSGTTLSEQILSRHSQVQAGGEKTFWPDFRNEILDPLAHRYDQKKAHRLGNEFLRILGSHRTTERYVTEKNPSNVILSVLLHCVYPNAKLLHVKRHPVDNALSIWMTPIRTGLPYVYDKQNLVTAFREYQRLVRHLERVLPEDRFKTVTYEEITSSPQSTITEMLNFLDLEPEANCFQPEANTRTVRTPSFYQVRQQINTASQEKWKRYQLWLGPFAELLDVKS